MREDKCQTKFYGKFRKRWANKERKLVRETLSQRNESGPNETMAEHQKDRVWARVMRY